MEGNRMKRTDQRAVEWCITSQLRGIRIKKPVFLSYAWYEPNKKRDLDNISGYGHKICQDALVACNVLKDDGWKYVVGFEDKFYVDRKNPRIEILIKEMQEQGEIKNGNKNKRNNCKH